ncbi:protein unc-93 homolog A-like [Crassostrea angulata]|uniref:protein unc-93 homolog A-like n=1 Tax=Magallana angulata TaxID=2784310 RepID=UPI0022B0B0C5|nr:protein unc-93 homolog A-like [Crassostrea angulata]
MKICFGCKTTEKEVGISGRETWNVVIISLSFFAVFTAYLALQNLQSSLNQEDGLGVISLSCLYAFIIVSAILAPWIIKTLGIKISLLISWVSHILYTCSNFYPTFATLIPTSILLGLISGPLWTSQSVFISNNAYSASELNRADTHATLSRLNGIFFTFYELTQITGNLVSSFVLNKDEYNMTSVITSTCGCNDCPITTSGNETSKIVEPAAPTVYLMLSIFLAFDVLGFLCTAAFLPSIPKSEWAEQSNKKESFTACFSALQDPKLAFLLPFISIMAMEQAVLWTDFTKSFISCIFGIQMVGFVMASYGCATTISALVTSRIAKYTGRYVLFSFAAAVNLAIFILLYVWVPTENQKAYVFAMAVMWGLGEGIWQTQSNALIALLFPERTEAAFANYHCTKAASFTVYFVISLYVCVKVKLLLVIVLLVVGSAMYAVVEVHVYRNKTTVNK